jgi:hypothetical protein
MNRAGVRGEFPDQKGKDCGENDRAENCEYNFQIVLHGDCFLQFGFSRCERTLSGWPHGVDVGRGREHGDCEELAD